MGLPQRDPLREHPPGNPAMDHLQGKLSKRTIQGTSRGTFQGPLQDNPSRGPHTGLKGPRCTGSHPGDQFSWTPSMRHPPRNPPLGTTFSDHLHWSPLQGTPIRGSPPCDPLQETPNRDVLQGTSPGNPSVGAHPGDALKGPPPPGDHSTVPLQGTTSSGHPP
jgi:hypothetical protein